MTDNYWCISNEFSVFRIDPIIGKKQILRTFFKWQTLMGSSVKGTWIPRTILWFNLCIVWCKKSAKDILILKNPRKGLIKLSLLPTFIILFYFTIFVIFCLCIVNGRINCSEPRLLYDFFGTWKVVLIPLLGLSFFRYSGFILPLPRTSRTLFLIYEIYL